jgi:hypothetical protein
MFEPPWYGSDQRWTKPFDAQALEDFGSRLSVASAGVVSMIGDPAAVRLVCGGVMPLGSLLWAPFFEPFRVYRVAGVDVQGRIEPVEVRVVFGQYSRFSGDTAFYDGRFFPSVYADAYPESPHRYADGALCLYYPRDPAHRRWVPDDGLRSLVSLAADHIFFEDVHRETGEWIAPEAPHGFPLSKARAA